jgi:probable HAF family extracellular repeat protein
MTPGRISAVFSVALVAPAALAQIQYFQGLGFLPGANSSAATAVSRDGRVIAGHSGNGPVRAFRWTAEQGLIALGELPGGDQGNAAFGISADGSTIVGRAVQHPGRRAFRWTAATGMAALGPSSRDAAYDTAYAASHDGSVIVGDGGADGGQHPFRWTSATGMAPLGDPERGYAAATSADGSVIVGQALNPAAGDEAYRWTADGCTRLGDLTGGAHSSAASDVTSDGAVVVGIGASAGGEEAFRWHSDTGMVGLGDLPGGAYLSVATGVSDDGSTITGFSSSDRGLEAFVWTEERGMVALQSLLDSIGLRPAGWALTESLAISGDGHTFVGVGRNPAGQTEGWVVRIPEPHAAVLLALPAAFARRGLRRRPAVEQKPL